MSQASAESVVPTDSTNGHALERIRDALRGLRFGTVSVIIQDGVVVQVERTEKLRLLKRERAMA
jgi:hypothetical protein